MAELVACLHHGEVDVLDASQVSRRLESPYRAALARAGEGLEAAPIVSVTRGRTRGELCYAVSSAGALGVFAQVLGSGQEQTLFHGPDTQLSELDFSLADEALACTVTGERGTSAIGVLSDDGKGVRTVTEGDVIDRAPRWAPGGRGEILYASAGIGRTKAGKAVERSPFALHRLRFSDNSVEVLMADAQYDYVAVIPVADHSLYALRRSYSRPPPESPFRRISRAVGGWFAPRASASATLLKHELVRVTPQGTELIARDVLAFDVGANEDVVYSDGAGVFEIAARKSTPELLFALEQVERLLIYW